MTATERRERQAQLFGESTTLLDICMDVRHGVRGDADWWPTEMVDATEAFLNDTLASWSPTAPAFGEDAEIDAAVRGLIVATANYLARKRMARL